MRLPSFAFTLLTASIVAGCAPADRRHEVGAGSEPLLRAGAEAEPDLTFLEVAGLRSRHVATSGDDAADGSQARPWRTIQRAIDDAAPGDAILVHAGTYTEHLAITATDGRSDAPIRLRSAAGEVVTLRANADRPLVRFARAFWIVEGVELDMAGRRNHAVRFEGARSSALALIARRRRARASSLST